jgi:hypothetical protein
MEQARACPVCAALVTVKQLRGRLYNCTKNAHFLTDNLDYIVAVLNDCFHKIRLSEKVK